jgi:myo-inositol-1(or 4)-monophosphatase
MTDQGLNKRDKDLISSLAQEAGKLAQDYRTRGLDIKRKADGTLITNADLAVNNFLHEKLLSARPEYGWQSEESPDDPARLSMSRLFVLDPIDGTRGFSAGSPFWSLSIAVVENGVPVAGIVHCPDTEETFAAVKLAGATRNNRPIRVSERAALGGASALGDHHQFKRPHWLEPWPNMDITTRPSIAYRMALVASGAYDFTMTLLSKSDWDLAAGALLIDEAGGKVTDHLGKAYLFNGISPIKQSLICSNSHLHPDLLARCVHLGDLSMILRQGNLYAR